jgi:Domain of unknown function (DUF4388)
MSLQGSFETIALPDVMALLAASNKSGELRVVGGQVEGRLWLQDGRLVGSNVGKAHGLVDSLFELLRLTEGNFVFKDGVMAPDPGEPTAIEGVVREAEDRLKEWHDIIQIVPTVEHRVRLIADLPTDEITLSAEDWHLVMAIALAGTVQGVIEELRLGQFEGCRGIRRLVDSGLVIVEPPRVRTSAPHRVARRAGATGDHGVAPASGPALSAPQSPLVAALAAATLPARAVAEPASPVWVLPAQHEGSDDALPPEFHSNDDYDYEEDHVEDEAEDLGSWQNSVLQGFADLEEEDVALPVAVGLEPPVSTARFALPSQSVGSDASPDVLRRRRARRQAAGAVDGLAGAAGEVRPPAPDDAEPDGGYDTDSGGEPINRGMLLKFLSSVRS